MKKSIRRKINLTVNETVLEQAKRVAEERGESLSSLVEGFLARLNEDSLLRDGDWLSRFHKKYLKPHGQELSDNDIALIKAERSNKYL